MTIASFVVATGLLALAQPSSPADATGEAPAVTASWFANANASSCNLAGSFGSKELNVVLNRNTSRGELVIHIVPQSSAPASPIVISTIASTESITLSAHDGAYFVTGELAEALRELLASDIAWRVSTVKTNGTRAEYEVSLQGSHAPMAAFDACASAL